MITGAIGQAKHRCDVKIHTCRDRKTALSWNNNFLLHATVSRHRDYAITRSKTINVAADFKHFARDFATGREREIRFYLIFAPDHENVWEINATGTHSHPQFLWAWGTSVNVLYNQHIWLAVFATKESFHAKCRVVRDVRLRSHFPRDRYLAVTTTAEFPSSRNTPNGHQSRTFYDQDDSLQACNV